MNDGMLVSSDETVNYSDCSIVYSAAWS